MAATAFAQPGDALAHGMAHHREHRDEAEHDASTPVGESPSLSSPEHGHDHVHGNVDDASVRNRVDSQAIAPEVELPESAMRDVTAESPPARAPLARGDPATGPPPRLRAPPIR